MNRRVRARQGDTLDAILYRAYGKTAGITETTLSMNRHLADYGATLPEGTPVVLPDPPAESTTKKPNVKLWD